MSSIANFTNLSSIANIDPLIHAAIASFGFVFVHPFLDGNGRLSRYSGVICKNRRKQFANQVEAQALDFIETKVQQLLRQLEAGDGSSDIRPFPIP
jgi:fido (protein-threonine AMPylation protein)